MHTLNILITSRKTIAENPASQVLVLVSKLNMKILNARKHSFGKLKC